MTHPTQHPAIHHTARGIHKTLEFNKINLILFWYKLKKKAFNMEFTWSQCFFFPFSTIPQQLPCKTNYVAVGSASTATKATLFSTWSKAPGTAGRLHQAGNVYVHAIFSRSIYMGYWFLEAKASEICCVETSSSEKPGWADGLMQHTSRLDPARQGFLRSAKDLLSEACEQIFANLEEEYFRVIFRVKKYLPGEIFAKFPSFVTSKI